MAKPKNKTEEYIASLEFKPVNFSRIKIFQRTGYMTRQGITCLTCGNTFDQPKKRSKVLDTNYLIPTKGFRTCPHCLERLKVVVTRKQTLNKDEYIQVITTAGGYQVIRVFLATLEARKGEQEKFNIYEVIR